MQSLHAADDRADARRRDRCRTRPAAAVPRAAERRKHRADDPERHGDVCRDARGADRELSRRADDRDRRRWTPPRARRIAHSDRRRVVRRLDGRLSATTPPAGRTSRTRAASRGARCATWRSVSCARRAATHGSVVRSLLLAQYRNADNLTDRLASLREIVNADVAGRTGQNGNARRLLYPLVGAEARHRSMVFGASGVPPSRRVGARRDAGDVTPTSTAGIRIDCARFTAHSRGQNPVNFHARDGVGLSLPRGARRAHRSRESADRRAPSRAADALATLRRRAARGDADALRGIESSDAISRDVYEVVTKTLQVEG